MKIKLQIEIWNSRIRAACFILILMKRGEWWRDIKEYVYIYIFVTNLNPFRSIKRRSMHLCNAKILDGGWQRAHVLKYAGTDET